MTPRKKIELQTKASALANELASWKKLAAEGAKFEKHHSQIERIAAQLDAAKQTLVAELDAPAGRPAEEIEERILDLHRVWNFFRTKLVVRAVEHFRPYLSVADELAYECYRPVINAKGDAFREPPLAFFNEDSSPYAMPRNRSYAFAIPGSQLTNQAAASLLKSLPVPVIGIPWFQQGHLPDLAIVAHEAGHHLEDDLGLGPLLDAALGNAGIPPVRLPAWLAWRGEVFGDVWAALAVGRAYPLALLDFLTSTDVDALRVATIAGPPWDDYPTAALRIAVIRAVLGNALDAETTTRLDPVRQHAMPLFDPDCPAVARAMLDTVCNGKKVSRLLDPFSESNASSVADNALNEGAIPNHGPRELVAGAVIAWVRDPVAFHAQPQQGESPHDRIVTRMRNSIAAGTRAVPPIERQKASVQTNRELDKASGVALLAVLRA